MADDFSGSDNIIIRENANEWGPFAFSFSAGTSIPTGTSVSSAVVYSELNGTDTTTNLIESASTTVSSDTVYVYFQYPGVSLTGFHTLFLELTLDTGAVGRKKFEYVRVV